MLTIFSIPKPFEGHAGLIQRNALRCWTRLPSVRVMLFGDEMGVAAAAAATGAAHFPQVARNRFGTPLVSDAFQQAARLAETSLLMFSNADMLYDGSLLAAVKAIRDLPKVLMSGRRLDLDLAAEMSGASDQEWRNIFNTGLAQGRLHGPAGMDYFVFPRGQEWKIPEFAVGRVGWDSWLVWHCRMSGIPVVDATRAITALHQNHDYRHLGPNQMPGRGSERDLNIRAAGGLAHLLTLREADWHLVGHRLVRPPWPQRITATLATTALYQRALALKRSLAK
jgi:hypothetical protein